MRKAEVNRKTGETDIRILLDLDGTGRSTVDTGVGFLDHILMFFGMIVVFVIDVWC